MILMKHYKIKIDNSNAEYFSTIDSVNKQKQEQLWTKI